MEYGDPESNDREVHRIATGALTSEAIRYCDSDVSRQSGVLDIGVTRKIGVRPIILVGEIAYPKRCSHPAGGRNTRASVEGRISWNIEIRLGRQIVRLLTLRGTIDANECIDAVAYGMTILGIKYAGDFRGVRK